MGFCDLAWGSGDLIYAHDLKTQFVPKNYLLVSLGEKVTSLQPQFLLKGLLAFDNQASLPSMRT